MQGMALEHSHSQSNKTYLRTLLDVGDGAQHLVVVSHKPLIDQVLFDRLLCEEKVRAELGVVQASKDGLMMQSIDKNLYTCCIHRLR